MEFWKAASQMVDKWGPSCKPDLSNQESKDLVNQNNSKESSGELSSKKSNSSKDSAPKIKITETNAEMRPSKKV